jgi:hypothetical protein
MDSSVLASSGFWRRTLPSSKRSGPCIGTSGLRDVRSSPGGDGGGRSAGVHEFGGSGAVGR